MELHSGETIIYEGHPNWRSILDFYIKGLVASIVVAAIVWFADTHAAGIGAFVFVFAVTLIMGLLKRIATIYMITTQRLYIRRGLFSRAEQQTHLERVQNVNTRQSFLERILFIGTVDFDTAGTDDSDFTFAGVGDPAGVVSAVERAQRGAAASA